MTIASRGGKIDEGLVNGFSERGLVAKKRCINDGGKPVGPRKKRGKKKVAVVMAMIFVMLAASLVVLTYKPYQVASNGFVLGEPVPYEKSYNPNLIKDAKFLGYMNGDQKIGIVIGFKWRNENNLNEFLSDVNNLSSPNYRHFLTWEQFKERYAPPKDLYNAMVQWLKNNGVHVEHTWAMRNAISIVDSVQNIEKAFHTKIGMYEGDGIHTRKMFYAAMEPFQVPANIITLYQWNKWNE